MLFDQYLVETVAEGCREMLAEVINTYEEAQEYFKFLDEFPHHYSPGAAEVSKSIKTS